MRHGEGLATVPGVEAFRRQAPQLRFHVIRQRVVSGTHVGELRLASTGGMHGGARGNPLNDRVCYHAIARFAVRSLPAQERAGSYR